MIACVELFLYKMTVPSERSPLGDHSRMGCRVQWGPWSHPAELWFVGLRTFLVRAVFREAPSSRPVKDASVGVTRCQNDKTLE